MRSLSEKEKFEMKIYFDYGEGSPDSYIQWHKEGAEEKLNIFKEKGWKIHNRWMEKEQNDYHEVKVLNAVIESPKGKLVKINWNPLWFCFFETDANQSISPDSKRFI